MKQIHTYNLNAANAVITWRLKRKNMENLSQQQDHRCTYTRCKATADFSTKLGEYCSYHLKVLRKKMGKEFYAQEIDLTKAQKKMLKVFRNNPHVQVNFNGGENETK